MLNVSHQISFWSRLFNVKSGEWSKIIFSWLIRFFYRLGFVLVWTLIVAQFVANYNISSLPYLFIFTAFFTMLGSIGFSTIVDRYSSRAMMISNILLSALVVAFVPVFFSPEDPLFIGLLLLTVVLFLKQFRLILNGYVEELFTPLQSERTFPLIEAADTLAGVIAGTLIALLVGKIDLIGLLNIASLAFIVIVPLLFLFSFAPAKKIELASPKTKVKKKYGLGVYSNLKAELRDKTYLKFLKGLIWLILLQWFLFNVLEFQYTKAVFTQTASFPVDYGSGFEHAFIHDLGQLFALFSSLALLFQLFLGSRIISSLGVFGSSVVHAVVSFFSFIAMFFNFNFSVSVFAKTNFTVTSVLYNNAYHSAYYAVHEETRAQMREFLEGVIRPIGAILGTLCLIILQNIFAPSVIDYYLNFLMVLIAAFIFYTAYRQQRLYTGVAVAALKENESFHEKVIALDILSQRGHRNGHKILRSIVFDSSLPLEVRILAIRGLHNFDGVFVVPILFELLTIDEYEIQSAVVRELSEFDESDFSGISFSQRYAFLNLVDALYSHDQYNEDFLVDLFSILRYFPDSASVEILFKALESSTLSHRLAAIKTIGYYNDLSLNAKIAGFLDSSIADEQAVAFIALYRTPLFADKSKLLLGDFLESSDSCKTALSLFACGELKLGSKKKMLFKSLKSHDLETRLQAAIALAKLGYRNGIQLILAVVVFGDSDVAIRVLKMIRSLDGEFRDRINRLLKGMVFEEIETILAGADVTSLSLDKIVRLRRLYYILGCSDETFNEMI
jgi:HEAT repeat protein